MAAPALPRTRAPLSPEERAQAVKPVDAWWTVLVVDPVAVRVLPWLRERTWVTPTGLTLAGGLVGVAAVLLFLAGRPVAAGACYEIRFLLDCLDGKLARLRGTTSAFGASLDVLLDVVLTTLTYAVVAAQVEPRLVTPVVAAALFEAWARDRRAAAAAGRPTATVTKPRRTRLALLPSTVDAESLALFVVPVVAWAAEPVALWAALVLLAAVSLDHVRVVLGVRLPGQR